MDIYKEIWGLIEPHFQKLKISLSDKLRGKGLHSFPFTKEGYNQVYKELYKKTNKIFQQESSTKHDWIRLQKEALESFFLLDDIYYTSSFTWIYIYDALSFLGDWLQLMLYPINYKFNISVQHICDDIYSHFLNQKREVFQSVLYNQWSSIIKNFEITSIPVIFMRKMIGLCKKLDVELCIDIFECTIQLFSGEEKELEIVLERLERLRPIFHFFFTNREWHIFLQKIRPIWMFDEYSKHLWIKALSQFDEPKVFLLINYRSYFDNSIDFWKFYSNRLMEKWVNAKLSTILTDYQFQQKCISQIKPNQPIFFQKEWETNSNNVLKQIFIKRKEFYKEIVENIQRDFDFQKWMVFLPFLMEKELFLNEYHSLLRSRLLENENMDLKREYNCLEALQNYIERGSLLNFLLMVKETERVATGNIRVYVISKIAWGIEKNPFSQVALPAFLEMSIPKESKLKIEHLLHLGSVLMKVVWGKKSKEIKMLPIQALILIHLQHKNKFDTKGLENVFASLEKDKLVTRKKETWILNSGLPSIDQCSAIEEKELKPNNHINDENFVEDYHIDAKIMYWLKKEKQIHHSILINKLKEHFMKEHVERFKKRIENLMEKEYLDRSEEDSCVYLYLS